jgi:hypothetical protein
LFSWQVECSHSPGTGKAMFKPLNTEHEWTPSNGSGEHDELHIDRCQIENRFLVFKGDEKVETPQNIKIMQI